MPRDSFMVQKSLLAAAIVAPLACGILLPGCGPDYNAIANRLREQNMLQERQISDQREKLAAQDARVRQLQEQLDDKLPRVQTLPDDRLAQLFTAAKIEIHPQTDSWQIDAGHGLTAFHVFLRAYTDDGLNIPATGNLTIEAFNLPAPPADPVRLGTWTFSPADMKNNWFSGLGLNQFAFNCPWKIPPASADVTFKVTFTDALTGRLLEAHLDKKVTLPADSRTH